MEKRGLPVKGFFKKKETEPMNKHKVDVKGMPNTSIELPARYTAEEVELAKAEWVKQHQRRNETLCGVAASKGLTNEGLKCTTKGGERSNKMPIGVRTVKFLPNTY